MPYIKREQRLAMDDQLNEIRPKDVGELNYAITQICRAFLFKSKMSYADHNAVVGVLESAKLEFYRRAVASYENRKMEENGDVY